MAGKYRKFTPEFREEATRMVVETSRPIADVARELGINERYVLAAELPAMPNRQLELGGGFCFALCNLP